MGTSDDKDVARLLADAVGERERALGMARFLVGLGELLEAHGSNAELAVALLHLHEGDWRRAFEFVKDADLLIRKHLRVLAMTVALEGKEREAQKTKPSNKE